MVDEAQELSFTRMVFTPHRPVFFWPSRHNFLYIKAEISHPYLTTKFENSSLKNI